MKTQKLLFVLLLAMPIIGCCCKSIQADKKDLHSSLVTLIPDYPDTAMIKNNNIFAIELYSFIKSDTQNVFFSPYSISAAMAMTYAGAREESERQISKVLRFDTNQAKFHPAYKTLLAYTNNLNKTDSIQISVANSLWAQKDYPFSDNYFKLITNNYNAAVQNLDFVHETENSRLSINKWVEGKTQNKIKDLLIPGILTDLTRLVLVNAIYFYGAWDKAFDVRQTTKGNFYVNSQKSVQVDLMVNENKFKYIESAQMQLLEIPYAGNTLSMLVLLPNEGVKIENIEKTLTNNQLSLFQNLMTATKIRLFLPKFRVTSEFELSENLIEMGMPHPFSRDADFSGMTGNKNLFIDKVIHKAFIDVSEKGTEAAASTAVVIREKNGMVLPEFRANRPFIFIIKENKYNNILFMGRINNPLI